MFQVRWIAMVELPLRILWEQCEAHTQTSTHTNRSHGPHTNTNNIYVHLEAYTTVVSVLGLPPAYSRCFGQLVFWVSSPKVDLLVNSIRQAVSPAHLNNNNKSGQPSMHD